MIAHIKNFRLVACRGRKDGPTRTIELSVDCPDSPELSRVFVNFFEKTPSTLGFANAAGHNLVVFLPVVDFQIWRELVERQQNAAFAWIADAEQGLVWAEITTSDEPLQAVEHVGVMHLVAPEANGETGRELATAP